MNLVSDWKRAHTWVSVQAMTAAGAIQGTLAAAPAYVTSHVAIETMNYLTIACVVLGIVGRVFNQGGPANGAN